MILKNNNVMYQYLLTLSCVCFGQKHYTASPCQPLIDQTWRRAVVFTATGIKIPSNSYSLFTTRSVVDSFPSVVAILENIWAPPVMILRSDESPISKIPMDFKSYYTVTSQYLGGVNTDITGFCLQIHARTYIVHAQNCQIPADGLTPTLRKRAPWPKTEVHREFTFIYQILQYKVKCLFVCLFVCLFI